MNQQRWIPTKAYSQMIDLVLSAAKVLSQPDLYAFYKGENATLTDLWLEVHRALETLVEIDYVNYIKDVCDRNTPKDWQDIYDDVIDLMIDKPSLEEVVKEYKKKDAFEVDQKGVYEAVQIINAMKTMNMYWTEP